MGEYHDLYLLTDVLLLSNVFNEFRSICMETYSLDPAPFYTVPGLTWASLLKSSRIELEPITDLNMLTVFEKVIRGIGGTARGLGAIVPPVFAKFLQNLLFFASNSGISMPAAPSHSS